MKILFPFSDATQVLSGSKYATISLLTPVLYKLIHVTLKIEGTDTTILKSIKNAICTDLKSRYESLEIQRLLNIAAFLDPRFKQLDPFVAEVDREDVVEQVITEVLLNCDQEIQDDQDNDTVELVTLMDDNQQLEETGPAIKKRKEGVGDVISHKASSKPTYLEVIRSEVHCYHHEMIAELNDDPLRWWSTQEIQYMHLKKVVKKYLCMPASSVRSEEVFSTAGNVLTHKETDCYQPM